MKVLITGAAGLFGYGLVEIFGLKHEVFPVTRVQADTTDAAAIRETFNRLRPEIVIHTAAIPDLDICEADPAKAFLVNVEGTRNVVEAARFTPRFIAGLQGSEKMALERWKAIETTGIDPFSAAAHGESREEKAEIPTKSFAASIPKNVASPESIAVQSAENNSKQKSI